MQLPQTIAIHGVGTHAPDQIKALVDEAFQRASIASDVSEFNWDAFTDHSVNRLRDGIAILDATAVSITNTAALPLPASAARGDGWLQRTGDSIYSVFRLLIATALTLLILGPVLHFVVLLPTTAFTSFALADLAWLGTAAFATSLTTAGVFAIMLGLDLVRSVIRRSPAPLLVTLRRGALLLLQPLILILTIPVSWRAGNGLVSMATSLIPLTIIGGTLNLVVSPLFGAASETAASIGFSVIVVLAAAVVGGLHILVRRLWIGGPLKVLLDIVRYMGSPSYRSTLQRAFDDRIQSLSASSPGGARHVVLLAHSLGSVIALDSLVNSTAWKVTDLVHLVTLGSPIQRSFIRFFPGYLFPASVDRAARLVAARLGHFSWTNIHRPWDYVGTNLGLSRASVGDDRSTGETRRVFSSHSNYWGDDLVVEQLKAGWHNAVAVSAAPAGKTDTTHVIPVATPPEALDRITALARIVAVMLVVAVAVTTIVGFISADRLRRERLSTDIAAVSQSGTDTLANVTYVRLLAGAGEERHYVHYFDFDLPELKTSLPQISIQDGLPDERFDYRALADFVLAQCHRTGEKRWWQIFKSELEIPCTRTAIAFRHDVRRPESFALPQFPPRARRWEGVSGGLGLILLSGFFAYGCVLVIVKGGLRLFRLFLGLTANE